MDIVGLLLAAGHSRRFGQADKLMHTLSDGRSIAVTAAQNLLAALPRVVAVTRPHNTELQRELRALGVTVTRCTDTEVEMADTLAAGVRLCAQAWAADDTQRHGVVIALADMPYIRSDTITRIVHALAAGAGIVVPTYTQDGIVKRGHPVAFAASFAGELLALRGDVGAKSLLQRYAQHIIYLPCDDPGILQDIDTVDDIQAGL